MLLPSMCFTSCVLCWRLAMWLPAHESGLLFPCYVTSTSRCVFHFISKRTDTNTGLRTACSITVQRNLRREEDFACRILQKAFRGFVGRALWRRLQFPLKERTRQLSAIQKHRARLQLYRNLRTNSARVIQQMARVRARTHCSRLRLYKIGRQTKTGTN